jgi:hypothetical protein
MMDGRIIERSKMGRLSALFSTSHLALKRDSLAQILIVIILFRLQHPNFQMLNFRLRTRMDLPSTFRVFIFPYQNARLNFKLAILVGHWFVFSIPNYMVTC